MQSCTHNTHYVLFLVYLLFYGFFWRDLSLDRYMKGISQDPCSALSRRGTNVCYGSRKSSFSTPKNVPLFPYYAHADNYSRLAIAKTILSSPPLIDKPATGSTVNVFYHIFKRPGLTSFCTSSRRVYCLPTHSTIYGASQIHGSHM